LSSGAAAGTLLISLMLAHTGNRGGRPRNRDARIRFTDDESVGMRGFQDFSGGARGCP
jgi:hypothetical protein